MNGFFGAFQWEFSFVFLLLSFVPYFLSPSLSIVSPALPFTIGQKGVVRERGGERRGGGVVFRLLVRGGGGGGESEKGGGLTCYVLKL